MRQLVFDPNIDRNIGCEDAGRTLSHCLTRRTNTQLNSGPLKFLQFSTKMLSRALGRMSPFARPSWTARAMSVKALGEMQLMTREGANTFIGGYNSTGFLINNCEVKGSVICMNKLFLMWPPNTIDEITVESLTLLTVFHPKPGA